MSIATAIIAILNPVLSNRIWFNTIPDNLTAAQRSAPFMVVQLVGGRDDWYVENTIPDEVNGHYQFFIWGANYLEVEACSNQVRSALATTPYAPHNIHSIRPLGGPVDDYNEILKLHGKRQDFSIWCKPLAPI